VRLLAAHKAEVMVALTEADERARPASRKCRAAVGAEYWRDLFDERAAHHEFDGGYSRADAERLAFGEMILEWHRLLGVPPEPNHCAGCGNELPGEGGSAYAMAPTYISMVFAVSIASSSIARSAEGCSRGVAHARVRPAARVRPVVAIKRRVISAECVRLIAMGGPSAPGRPRVSIGRNARGSQTRVGQQIWIPEGPIVGVERTR